MVDKQRATGHAEHGHADRKKGEMVVGNDRQQSRLHDLEPMTHRQVRNTPV